MFFILTNSHRIDWLFGFSRRVLCVGITLHGIIRIWLYRLTGDELRQRCQERRLVARGPIRLLRERFSTYVKCSPVEASCYVNMVQASAKTDKAASNNVDPVPRTVDPCSLEGCVWTVRLRCWWNCYSVDSLSSEGPADILQILGFRREKEKVATTCTEDGQKQNTKTSFTI
jgi:hypothetical protein